MHLRGVLASLLSSALVFPVSKCTLDLYQAYDIGLVLWVEATLLPHILHPLFHHLPTSGKTSFSNKP
jgi:hypothetical protein